MTSQAPRRSTWVVMSVAAIVLAISAGYLVFVDAAERMLESTCIEQMAGSVGVLASRIHGQSAEVVAALSEIATRCASRGVGPEGECAADLDRLRHGLPALFAATILLDREGAILSSAPPRQWRADELAAIQEARREAGRGAGQSIRVSASAPRGGKTLFAVAAIPSDAPTSVGAVGVAIDLNQVAIILLERAIPNPEGLAFLALQDGRLIGTVGGEQWRSVASLGDLLGAEWAEVLRRSEAASGSEHGVLRLATPTGHGRMLGVVEPVNVPGGRWMLGALVPAGSLVRGVRPILFGGAVLVVVTLAGIVAALAVSKRAIKGQASALLDANRWRDLAQQRQREGRWRGLADRCPTPVVCLSGSTVVAANLSAMESLGNGNPQQLVGTDFLGFAANEDRELLQRHLGDQGKAGATRRVTAVRLTTARGRTFVAEIAVTAVRELDEELVYVAWEEVGARRRGEAVLAAVAGVVPLALVLTDLSGNLLWANGAAFDLAGAELRRLQGRSLRSLVERSHLRVAISALARARRGTPAGGHVRVLGNGGTALAAEFKAIPVRTDGTPTGVLFVLSEIETPPDGGRESSAVTRERALAQLSTSLAHRVRNDFQALLGLLDRLRTGEAAEHALSLARGLVTDSAEDLRRFFVAVSKGEDSALRPVRLGPLLNRWLEKVTTGVPGNVRVTLRQEAHDDRVIADAEQILLWLDVSLSAALAAMDLGGAVEVELHDGGEQGTVRVAFSDTGSTGEAAMPPGDRRRFSSRQTAQALAELVAARLGGRTGGTTGSGLRSRFWIELPCVRSDTARGESAPSAIRRGALLLADDEEMVRITLATALRSAGYEVVEARNGLEVVEKVLVAPDRFALVVLDLVMPVMDGREALRRLRECAPALPVVVCTGYDPTGDGVLAAAGLLIKPFSIAELLDKVSEFTGQHPVDT
ncbi:MAG: response regulator [Acidobacteriia bacterium]|nr:response regulator [Terriglobia bacterium]